MMRLIIFGGWPTGVWVPLKPSYRNITVINYNVNKTMGLIRIMMMITKMRRTFFSRIFVLFSFSIIYLHKLNNVIKKEINKIKTEIYTLLRFYDGFMMVCFFGKAS